MATKLLLAIFLSLLVSAAVGRNQSTRLSEAQQCRLQRLTASQPSQSIQSEGGTTELWNEREDQFQCVGVAALRNTLRPNSLSLPNFHPAPRLVYIEKGQGLIGITFPGCAETYHSKSQQSRRGQEEEEQQQQQEGRGRKSDLHQKVHRFRRGDIIALPAGAAHWCYNDGNEDLVAVSITDLNNQANQLDQKLRAFYLAGGVPTQGQQGQNGQQARETFQNIFRAFDEELMAEAFNVPREIVRRMQQENERGLIVKVREGMSVIRPDEEEQQQQQGPRADESNGLEENICSMKISTNIDNRREADIYSRQAGKINIVNQHKLPILRLLDMSASKGNLLPNALFTPHWSMNGHNIVYVTRGEAQVQVVGSNGQTVLNERVNRGNMFVVPQFYASTVRAGRDGFEWVTFKTTGSPMSSPLAGYTSVFRAMPLQVITNSYQISPSEAQNLKLSRGGQSYLLSPGRRSS
ncbi:hypothetical protein RJ640_019587 [Escallonia rubra]|uniref:Cupin type-1 domain-containing protein n=1 Tax=Escallonia rubra TaxID=112253 RepID=A0AA88UQE3_9ASTE|nr:hypothetical protein RJ640_019587 [Escallonia rubra]